MSDEQSMVEKVARAIDPAIWLATSETPEEASRVQNLRNTSLYRARVAISAMWEPTQAMYDALSATGKMWRDLDSQTVWQTYIDAALKDAP
jgi:hypothetical protein